MDSISLNRTNLSSLEMQEDSHPAIEAEKSNTNLRDKRHYLTLLLTTIFLINTASLINHLTGYLNTDIATLTISALTILLLVPALLNYKNSILTPAHLFQQSLQNIAEGKLDAIHEKLNSSIFSGMIKCLAAIMKNHQRAIDFVESIGEGRELKELEEADKENKLITSLHTMQKKLEVIAQEEKKRVWISSGLGHLNDILRNQNQNIYELCDKVLSQVIKYSTANQGRLYITEEDNDSNEYLQLASCYAWGKKKLIEDRIEPGYGLAGQCWIEKEPIYITAVPGNYVKITSGLGMATPTCIFLMPLLVHDKVHGILEIATMKALEPHEKEFISSACTNIAATINNIKTTMNVKKLLQQSEENSEELQRNRAIMEESIEKLQLSQEEMRRKEEELNHQLKEVFSERRKNQAILEGCVDAVINFSETGEIHFFNRAAEEIFGYSRREVLMKPVSQILGITVSKNDENKKKLVTQEGYEINVRTEISTFDKRHQELALLLTATEVTDFEDHSSFTLFAQKISADLF